MSTKESYVSRLVTHVESLLIDYLCITLSRKASLSLHLPTFVLVYTFIVEGWDIHLAKTLATLSKHTTTGKIPYHTVNATKPNQPEIWDGQRVYWKVPLRKNEQRPTYRGPFVAHKTYFFTLNKYPAKPRKASLKG